MTGEDADSDDGADPLLWTAYRLFIGDRPAPELAFDAGEVLVERSGISSNILMLTREKENGDPELVDLFSVHRFHSMKQLKDFIEDRAENDGLPELPEDGGREFA